MLFNFMRIIAILIVIITVVIFAFDCLLVTIALLLSSWKAKRRGEVLRSEVLRI